jgi:hypothetical protein
MVTPSDLQRGDYRFFTPATPLDSSAAINVVIPAFTAVRRVAIQRERVLGDVAAPVAAGWVERKRNPSASGKTQIA